MTSYLLRQTLPPVGKRCRGLDQPYTEPLTPFTPFMSFMSLAAGRAPERAPALGPAGLPLPSGAAPSARPGRAPVSPLVP